MNYPSDFINKVICGDCLEIMRTFPKNLIDTIITDPPYGIGFMGKEWDNFKPSRIDEAMARDKRPHTKIASQRRSNTAGAYDFSPKGLNGFQEWMTRVAKELLQVTKPGGTMLIFGGTRTYYRLACAIEDAGWIIKDTIMWLYGSGFPKATDISKQLDKRGGDVGFKIFWEVRNYLKSIIKKSGKTQKEIKKFLGYPLNSGIISHWVGNSQPTIPSKRDWFKLKELLKFESPFDEGYRKMEAERKVIGLKDCGFLAKNNVFNLNNPEYGKVDITEPSTPEAKLWNGWKSHGLKPAYEPIIVAMKPNEGSYAQNALKHGVSGLNIDGGRIGTEEIKTMGPKGGRKFARKYDGHTENLKANAIQNIHKGRFPANIILDEEAAKMLDEQSGILTSGKMNSVTKGHDPETFNTYGKQYVRQVKASGGKGGASRFFKIITNSKEDLLCLKNNINVDIAGMSLLTTNPTGKVAKMYFVLKNALRGLDSASRYLNVLSVGKELKRIEINVARYLVRILIDGIRVAIGDQVIIPQLLIGLTQEQLLIILTDIKNLVLYVEKKKQKDIIQIIKNLNELCGYAEDITCKSIQARFKYCAKASKSERNMGCEEIKPKQRDESRKEGNPGGANPRNRGVHKVLNNHPTVKPLKLMEYLCTLTKTPTGGIVLDPFAGSGTTGMACKLTGRDYILIEKEPEYVKIAEARIKATHKPKHIQKALPL